MKRVKLVAIAVGLAVLAASLAGCWPDGGVNDRYQEGYREGYATGRAVGYKEGYQVGYEEGKTAGRPEGAVIECAAWVDLVCQAYACSYNLQQFAREACGTETTVWADDRGYWTQLFKVLRKGGR